jgi:hypothetical protein
VGAGGAPGDDGSGASGLPEVGVAGLDALGSVYGMLVLLDGGRDGGMIAGLAAGDRLDAWPVAPKASRGVAGVPPDDTGEPLFMLP